MKPNDGLCHLDPKDKTYQKSLSQDYPSLGQISHLAKKNYINLIFAVTNEVAPRYQEFQKVISGSSVGILDQDSENIVMLIRDSYKVPYFIYSVCSKPDESILSTCFAIQQNISSSVEMTDTAGASVRVRYYTNCNGILVQENRKCDDLKIGDEVNFIISIEVWIM